MQCQYRYCSGNVGDIEPYNNEQRKQSDSGISNSGTSETKRFFVKQHLSASESIQNLNELEIQLCKDVKDWRIYKHKEDSN